MKKFVLATAMTALLCSTALADIEYLPNGTPPGTESWTLACNIDKIVTKHPQKMDDKGVVISLYFPSAESIALTNLGVVHHLTNGNTVDRTNQYKGVATQPNPERMYYIWKGTHYKHPYMKMIGHVLFGKNENNKNIITYTEEQTLYGKKAYTMYSTCQVVNIDPASNIHE